MDNPSWKLELADLLRDRLAVIADRELRERDSQAHLDKLRGVSEKIASAHVRLRTQLSARLDHFLANCSYDKALAELGSGTQTAFAPGRVELLGNHTDYNEGFVLSAAIQFGVHATGELLAEDRIRVESAPLGPPVEAVLTDLIPRVGTEAWANYVLGVAAVFCQAGYPVGGFRIRLDSDLPVGAGLSSSAAVEVATATLLKKLFGFEIPTFELAKLCRRAENEFVGVNCGLLDQVSSAFGERDHAVFLDCREESIERIPFPPALALLITRCGVDHALVGGEYNERREQCMAAARLLGVRALRDADSAALEAAADRLPDLVLRRARHVVGENARVREGIRLLRDGDGAGFGRLMFASHESSRTNFENSTPELDALVEIAAALPGVLGARLTGGGFGGATVSLVEKNRAPEIARTLAGAYRKQTGHTATPFLCEVSGGTH